VAGFPLAAADRARPVPIVSRCTSARSARSGAARSAPLPRARNGAFGRSARCWPRCPPEAHRPPAAAGVHPGRWGVRPTPHPPGESRPVSPQSSFGLRLSRLPAWPNQGSSRLTRPLRSSTESHSPALLAAIRHAHGHWQACKRPTPWGACVQPWAAAAHGQQKAPAVRRGLSGFRFNPDLTGLVGLDQAGCAQPMAGAVRATGVASAAARSRGKL